MFCTAIICLNSYEFRENQSDVALYIPTLYIAGAFALLTRISDPNLILPLSLSLWPCWTYVRPLGAVVWRCAIILHPIPFLQLYNTITGSRLNTVWMFCQIPPGRNSIRWYSHYSSVSSPICTTFTGSLYFSFWTLLKIKALLSYVQWLWSSAYDGGNSLAVGGSKRQN
jgi:hypothetical protein